MLGIADHVVMTADAYAYVSGPASVQEFTGLPTTSAELGGADVHARRSGLASLVVADEAEAAWAVGDLLSYLPSHWRADAPVVACDDPVDRPCRVAATTVPDKATASYDVRTVIGDIVDRDSFLEVRAGAAPNVVTGYGRLDGAPVGVIANQPSYRAGTLDIDASTKAARFVQCCDAFGIPLVTFVDSSGFQPGKDIEWQGIIRYGAQLVAAYSAATVPRICVVLRKAYGGAYIVMDSRGLGSDLVLAWPTAEIAVMGAPGRGADPPPPPPRRLRRPRRPGPVGVPVGGRLRLPLLHAPGGGRAGLRRRRDRPHRHPPAAGGGPGRPPFQAGAPAGRSQTLQPAPLDERDEAPIAARR